MSTNTGGVVLEPVDASAVDWNELGARPERGVFQTRAWLDFLAQSQRARPALARVVQDGQPVGWFTGAVNRRLGVRVLGSPFPGWTTSYMGFDLDEGADRTAALGALERYAFGPLRCSHVEIMDRWLPDAAGLALGYAVTTQPGYEVDLQPGLEEISAAMSHSARWAVGRAEREGVTIVGAEPDEAAADRFHRLVTLSFARRQQAPRYSVERVRQLFATVGAAGDLTVLEAHDPQGQHIAGVVLVHHGQSGHLWGAGSDAAGHKLSPNEALHWEAIVRLRALGCIRYDMGGGGAFKEKFGGAALAIPWFRKGRWPIVERARDVAAGAQRRQQRSVRS